METKTEFDLIIAVITRGFSDYVVSAAREAGATGATIVYGRGTADADKQVMGISLQPEREAVLILVPSKGRRKIMQEIADKTSLMEEGMAICFSLPVSDVYGLRNVEKDRKIQDRKAKMLAKMKAEKKKTQESNQPTKTK